MVAFVYTFSRHSAHSVGHLHWNMWCFASWSLFLFFLYIQETYGDEECSWWVSTVRPSGGRCDPDKSGRLPVTYLTFPEVELRLIHHLLHLCASVLALYIFAPLLTAVVPRQLRKLLHNQL